MYSIVFQEHTVSCVTHYSPNVMITEYQQLWLYWKLPTSRTFEVERYTMHGHGAAQAGQYHRPPHMSLVLELTLTAAAPSDIRTQIITVTSPAVNQWTIQPFLTLFYIVMNIFPIYNLSLPEVMSPVFHHWSNPLSLTLFCLITMICSDSDPVISVVSKSSLTSPGWRYEENSR